jgi:Mrp family chromosome partitioning ATPase
MARILDTLGRSGRPAPPAAVEPKTPTERSLVADDSLESNDVPFIEVGGPPPRLIKSNADRLPIPAIIPMSRPAPRTAEPTDPQETTFFRISFQPLPFPTAPGDGTEHHPSRELVAYHYPDHPVSEQYRMFARELEAQLGTEPGKSLLFTAVQPGCGTTSVVLNLAVTLARQDRCRVAVIDAQFARPACAARLGAAPAPGLREVLARTVPLLWALQVTALPNLHLLANGALSAEPAMDAWPALLDQMRQRFDLIIVDAAEWGARTEPPALTATCMATYMVLQPADLTGSDVNDVLTEIPRHGGQLRGYVLAQR